MLLANVNSRCSEVHSCQSVALLHFQCCSCQLNDVTYFEGNERPLLVFRLLVDYGEGLRFIVTGLSVIDVSHFRSSAPVRQLALMRLAAFYTIGSPFSMSLLRNEACVYIFGTVSLGFAE